MDKTIECPICEAEFQLKEQSNSVVRCPICARKFRLESLKSEVAELKRARSQVPNPPPEKPTSEIATPKLPIPNVDGVVEKVTKQSTNPPLPTGEQETQESVATTDTVERKKAKPQVAMPVAIPLDSTAAEAAKALPVASPVEPPTLKESESKTPSLVAVRQRYKKRNRQRTYLTLALAGILGLIIASLTTWIVIRLNPVEEIIDDFPKSELAGNDDFDDSARSSNNRLSPSNIAPRSIQNSTNIEQQTVAQKPDPPKPKKIELASLPRQKFDYLSRADVENTWLLMQPRLVTLTVYRQNETTRAVGLIVDSRGWVLTSFHAIAGATKIEVTASAKVIDDLYEADLLRDEARGIIAHDKQRDLAILSVNRRFVSTFGGIEYGKKGDMVSGQYTILAAPPSPENPYARIEVKVSNRFDMNALPQAAKRKAESLQIADPKNVWIEAELTSMPLPGSMLFNAQSELNGIYTFSVGELRYFLLTDQIANSIKNASDDPQPLLTIASAAQKKAMATASEMAVLTTDPIGSTVRELTKAGQACESFGWIATNEKQFSKFQTFAARMSEVETFIAENKSNRSERATVASLNKQKKKWKKAISNAIASRNKQQLKDSKKMIELAAKVAKQKKLSGDQRYIPFFGKVYVAGIVSPDPDAIFVSIGRDAGYIKAPFPETDDTMLPESEWLFFILRNTDKVTTSQRYGGSTFSAETGQIMFAIPLPSSL